MRPDRLRADVRRRHESFIHLAHESMQRQMLTLRDGDRHTAPSASLFQYSETRLVIGVFHWSDGRKPFPHLPRGDRY
jgi:hypothetical protein